MRDGRRRPGSGPLCARFRCGAPTWVTGPERPFEPRGPLGATRAVIRTPMRAADVQPGNSRGSSRLARGQRASPPALAPLLGPHAPSSVGF